MNIRKKFLNYFKNHKHKIISSSSVIPVNDNSLLFTNSGMVQFKDIFLGNEKPKHKRVVTCQKCLRVGGKHNDLDNIGFTNRHQSFFEMLGNFSFGDYFKEEAILLSWNFLTKELKLDKNKLYISVHKDDSECADIWTNKIGIKDTSLSYLGDKDNFWQMGDIGPCGPCTEIYYDLGNKLIGSKPGTGDTGERFSEIWNLVFTQFDKDSKGKLKNLPKKCVDTGMGLERIHAVLEKKSDNFETSIFNDLYNYLNQSSKIKKINFSTKKIIMDHCRAACILISDGVIPDKEGRGYILRRLIRRSIRYLYNSGITEPFLNTCVDSIKNTLGKVYPEIKDNTKKIKRIILNEEQSCLNTLSHGLQLINKFTINKKSIDGETVFKLYDTYGLPVEITQEIANEKNLSIDLDGFTKLMKEQKIKSKKSSMFKDSNLAYIDTNLKSKFTGYEKKENQAKILAIYFNNKPYKKISTNNKKIMLILSSTSFYPEGGGQVADTGTIENKNCIFDVENVYKLSNSIVHYGRLKKGKLSVSDKVTCLIDINRRRKITSNHSSTHLLHQALREVLGNHVQQQGSLVNDKYLRFDFTHSDPLTDKQIKSIEKIIMNEIKQDTKTQIKNMSYEKAIQNGALAFFDEKYEDNVRVLHIGSRSIELCGGTHVESTSSIGMFKIISESSVSTGVRRIEAITGEEVYQDYQNLSDLNKNLCNLFNSNTSTLLKKALAMQDIQKDMSNDISMLNKTLAKYVFKSIQSDCINIKSSKLFLKDCTDLSIDQIKSLSDLIKNQFNDSISIFVKNQDNKISCYIGVSKSSKHIYNAKQIVEKINNQFNSKGGGSETFATTIILDQTSKNVLSFVESVLKIN